MLTLEDIKKANQKAGGRFFSQEQMKYVAEHGGTHEVNDMIVTTTFPQSSEYPEGHSYKYEFHPATGRMLPVA